MWGFQITWVTVLPNAFSRGDCSDLGKETIGGKPIASADVFMLTCRDTCALLFMWGVSGIAHKCVSYFQYYS